MSKQSEKARAIELVKIVVRALMDRDHPGWVSATFVLYGAEGVILETFVILPVRTQEGNAVNYALKA